MTNTLYHPNASKSAMGSGVSTHEVMGTSSSAIVHENVDNISVSIDISALFTYFSETSEPHHDHDRRYHIHSTRICMKLGARS